jgi:Concanavalin A-like lectin/glucanases superfamily
MALADLNLFTAVDSNVKAFWNLQESNATDTWDNGEGTAAWDLVPNSGNEPQVSTTTVNGDFARSRIGDNNDYASMTDPGFPTGAFTIEMIVYGDDDTADTEGIFAQYNTTAGAANRSFFVQRGGGSAGTNRTFQFGVSGDGTTFQTVSTAQLNNAQWYYVTCVYEPSVAIRIFIDGVEVATNTTSIPASLNNATTIIAAMRYNATWGGANAFDGLLQAMRVSDTARSAAFILGVWGTIAWTYEQDFDALSTGNLSGQDSWTYVAGAQPQVQGTVFQSSSYGISGALNSNINTYRDITAITQPFIVYVSMRVDNVSSIDNVGFRLNDTATAIGIVMLNAPNAGDISIRDPIGGSYTTITTGISANTWYRVGIEFDPANDRFRGNVNNGTWSAWRTLTAYSQVNRIVLEGNNGDGSTTNGYWDNISASYNIPQVILFNSKSAVSATTATSLTFPFDNLGGNFIIVAGHDRDTGGSSAITGVTYNGVALTAGPSAQTPSDRYVTLWYGNVSDTGTNNVVVSASASVPLRFSAYSYSGVATASPSDGTDTSTGTTVTTISTDITTVTDNAWMFMFTKDSSGGKTVTSSTSDLVRMTADAGGHSAIDTGGPITPAAANTMTVSWTGSTNISALALAFKPDTGVITTKTTFLLSQLGF